MSNLRRTKIVCTLGPSTAHEEGVETLIRAGTDVIRFNFSHGEHDGHRRMMRTARSTADRLGRPVALLQDLGGPKIRLGELPGGDRHLSPGERVDLVPDDGSPGDALPVGYPHLLEDVDVGERILLADGLVELEVRDRSEERLVTEVVVGGAVSSRKGVNLPGSVLRVDSFTDKDREDLEVGLEEGVDLVALSFVRHEDDVAPVRSRLLEVDDPPLLIAKIEKPQAVERMCEILQVVDAVMVARGDLGVEMPVEEVPLIQKRIIREARRAGKPVITATQMLRSMVDNPRPTRAEATDVANAILDGTDAVMLSEESAVGRWPERAVEVLDRIARHVEGEIDSERLLTEATSDVLPPDAAAVTRAASMLAHDLDAAAIVATTSSGGTARLIARLRPPAPVVALSPTPSTVRRLALSWGVVPGLVDGFDDQENAFAVAESWCRERNMVSPGDTFIVTAGVPLHVAGTTNLLRVITVGDGEEGRS